MPFIRVLCISNGTSLGSLQRFEEATGESEGSLGSRLRVFTSPVLTLLPSAPESSDCSRGLYLINKSSF